MALHKELKCSDWIKECSIQNIIFWWILFFWNESEYMENSSGIRTYFYDCVGGDGDDGDDANDKGVDDDADDDDDDSGEEWVSLGSRRS